MQPLDVLIIVAAVVLLALLYRSVTSSGTAPASPPPAPSTMADALPPSPELSAAVSAHAARQYGAIRVVRTRWDEVGLVLRGERQGTMIILTAQQAEILRQDLGSVVEDIHEDRQIAKLTDY
ncbi:hypothetical protein [Lewinella sp. JB7]|uniref:hypothetical protein n=1 Tax=Lewinella sp. JB7 TaxID=2962887 RepID=UPI0020C9F282|nr:hypothetical protein [Lewinella sp. JB7]MCP9237179.1 hypothetical protein [Lewinella sp. JB7]